MLKKFYKRRVSNIKEIVKMVIRVLMIVLSLNLTVNIINILFIDKNLKELISFNLFLPRNLLMENISYLLIIILIIALLYSTIKLLYLSIFEGINMIGSKIFGFIKLGFSKIKKLTKVKGV